MMDRRAFIGTLAGGLLTAPLAAFRERREKEGLTEGAVEVEFYRSLTD